MGEWRELVVLDEKKTSGNKILRYYPLDSDKKYLAAVTTPVVRNMLWHVSAADMKNNPIFKDHIYCGQWHLRDVYYDEEEDYTTDPRLSACPSSVPWSFLRQLWNVIKPQYSILVDVHFFWVDFLVRLKELQVVQFCF